jgi:hypothetical protein
LNIQVKKERKKVWSNRKKYAFFAPAFRKGGSVQPVMKRKSRTGKKVFAGEGFQPGWRDNPGRKN